MGLGPWNAWHSDQNMTLQHNTTVKTKLALNKTSNILYCAGRDENETFSAATELSISETVIESSACNKLSKLANAPIIMALGQRKWSIICTAAVAETAINPKLAWQVWRIIFQGINLNIRTNAHWGRRLVNNFTTILSVINTTMQIQQVHIISNLEEFKALCLALLKCTLRWKPAEGQQCCPWHEWRLCLTLNVWRKATLPLWQHWCCSKAAQQSSSCSDQLPEQVFMHTVACHIARLQELVHLSWFSCVKNDLKGPSQAATANHLVG